MVLTIDLSRDNDRNSSNERSLDEKGWKMFYAERNADGTIIAVKKADEPSGKKEITPSELMDFLTQKTSPPLPFTQVLSYLDNEMVRVLDDLIDLLVQKNIIVLTDLPEDARKKLFNRKAVRHKMQAQDILADDIL